jgi:hypothetical protein
MGGGAGMNPTNLKKGDYVIATKYSDGDAQDHWCVGFFDCQHGHFGETRYIVVDETGIPFRRNGFRRIAKIKQQRGKWIVDNMKKIELSGLSVWNFYKCPIPKQIK